MQEYADVIPGNTDFAAYVVFLPLLQKDRPQDGLVAFRQFFQYLADHPARVFCNDAGQGIRFAGNEAFRGLILQGLGSTGGAKVLG